MQQQSLQCKGLLSANEPRPLLAPAGRILSHAIRMAYKNLRTWEFCGSGQLRGIGRDASLSETELSPHFPLPGHRSLWLWDGAPHRQLSRTRTHFGRRRDSHSEWVGVPATVYRPLWRPVQWGGAVPHFPARQRWLPNQIWTGWQGCRWKLRRRNYVQL